MTRIAPLDAPYEPSVRQQLESMMPPGVPPIGLFRTFARNLPMTRAMGGWGAYELGRSLSLSLREREIVIDRTTARCGCEYEWGVHIVFFAERAELTSEMITSLVHGSADDPCWTSPREGALIRAIDALHTAADIDDVLWGELEAHFSEPELLDVCMLVGWYHAISFTANAARLDNEPGAPRFEDYLPGT